MRAFYIVKKEKVLYSIYKSKTEADGMKRRFNVTGCCNPQRHYMVRLDDRLKKFGKIMWTMAAILSSTGADSMGRRRHSLHWRII